MAQKNLRKFFFFFQTGSYRPAAILFLYHSVSFPLPPCTVTLASATAKPSSLLAWQEYTPSSDFCRSVMSKFPTESTAYFLLGRMVLELNFQVMVGGGTPVARQDSRTDWPRSPWVSEGVVTIEGVTGKWKKKDFYDTVEIIFCWGQLSWIVNFQSFLWMFFFPRDCSM